jgi:hypothetical protein
LNFFFEHPMATYAAALAYRGLFPFVPILVVLAGALGSPDSFDRLIEQASSESSKHVPQQLEPVVEQGREQIQPLQRKIDQAEKQAWAMLLPPPQKKCWLIYCCPTAAKTPIA